MARWWGWRKGVVGRRPVAEAANQRAAVVPAARASAAAVADGPAAAAAVAAAPPRAIRPAPLLSAACVVVVVGCACGVFGAWPERGERVSSLWVSEGALALLLFLDNVQRTHLPLQRQAAREVARRAHGGVVERGRRAGACPRREKEGASTSGVVCVRLLPRW